jgi:quercetin dioxygenase-like cupin family protein
MEYLNIGNEIAGIVVRRETLAGQDGFFTTGNMALQAGVMSYDAGHIIQRHMHRPHHRQIVGTPEVIIVQEGTLTLDFYPSPEATPQPIVLAAGDLVILYAGGHGFTANTDTRILEIKQGPYLDADDKEYF